MFLPGMAVCYRISTEVIGGSPLKVTQPGGRWQRIGRSLSLMFSTMMEMVQLQSSKVLLSPVSPLWPLSLSHLSLPSTHSVVLKLKSSSEIFNTTVIMEILEIHAQVLLML